MNELRWQSLNDDVEFLLDFSIIVPPEKVDLFIDGVPPHGYAESNYLGALDGRCKHCGMFFSIRYLVKGMLVVGYYNIGTDCEHKDNILHGSIAKVRKK